MFVNKPPLLIWVVSAVPILAPGVLVRFHGHIEVPVARIVPSIGDVIVEGIVTGVSDVIIITILDAVFLIIYVYKTKVM